MTTRLATACLMGLLSLPSQADEPAPLPGPLARVGVKSGQSPITLHGVVGQEPDGTLNFPGKSPWGWVGVGADDSPLDALEELRSLTICGWARTVGRSVGAGGNRIAFNLNHNHSGFDLVYLPDGRLRLAVNTWPDSISNDSSPEELRRGEWVFFAVSYDGTRQADNVRWSFGNPTTPASLDRVTSLDAGATGPGSGPLAIGNFNKTLQQAGMDRQFRGQLHGLQIFGSTTGPDGALTLDTLRDLQSRADTRPNFDAPLPADVARTTPRLASTEQTDPAATPSHMPIPRAGTRPRVVVTTDGEIDDRCSMARFLLYANEFDIEALIYSSSMFHWEGHNWDGTTWIEEDIARYATFQDRLNTHATGFPTPADLREKIHVGNINNVGAMDADTPGSNRIVEILLDDKPGPVYLQAWGGTNTIARALWKIQHDHPAEMQRVSDKAIIYIILDQDATYRQYIQPNWPDLPVILSRSQFSTIAYTWEQEIPEEYHSYFDQPWMDRHILNNHGPLCQRYEAESGKGFRSEGDSPAFMHQIEVGLRSLENPAYGGWGGRFVKDDAVPSLWRDARDGGDLRKPIWRFAPAFQNDWAARADWCVADYGDANHPPVAKVSGPLDRRVKPGQVVELSALGTSDPDDNPLHYRWWQYADVDTAQTQLEIQNPEHPTNATFQVPPEPGASIHIILEVTDSGDPPLTRYQRIIFQIEE